MGIIRNSLRKLIDRELGVLGEQLDRLQSTLEDINLRVASYGDRFDRFSQRAGMRLTRAAASEQQDGSLAEFNALLKKERVAGGNGADVEAEPWQKYV